LKAGRLRHTGFEAEYLTAWSSFVIAYDDAVVRYAAHPEFNRPARHAGNKSNFYMGRAKPASRFSSATRAGTGCALFHQQVESVAGNAFGDDLLVKIKSR